MNNIYSILTLVLMGFLIFSGVNQINQHAYSLGNLDNESVDIMNTYNTNLKPINQTNLNSSMSIDYASDVDVSGFDSFFKEFQFLKKTFDAFRSGIYLFVNIPNMLFVSLPFITANDINIYTGVLGWLIAIIIGLAIYKGIATKEVDR